MTTSPTDSATVIAVRRADLLRDQITLLRGTAIVALGYGIGAALQSTFVYAMYIPAWAQVSFWARFASNVTAVVVLVGVLAAAQAHRATRVLWIVGSVVVASGASAGARFGRSSCSASTPTPPTRCATRSCSAASSSR